jgi:hypothetical protein
MDAYSEDRKGASCERRLTHPRVLVRIAIAALACCWIACASAAPFTGPTSSYYVDNYADSTIYIVQGTSVVGSFALSGYSGNADYQQGSLAVGATVATHGFYSGYGSLLQAGHYTLSGMPTGVGYDSYAPLAGMQVENSYDGTTDGTYNYYVQYAGYTTGGTPVENVVQTDLDWQNPTVLFSVQTIANACCEFLGITYDPANASLWVSGWTLSDIRDYSLSGTLLSSFSTGHTGNGALAYDPADGTLWISYDETNVLEQYSTTGTLLQSGTPTGLPYGYYLAGEFQLAQAAVPEPASLALVGLGLTAAGIGHRVRHRSSN